MDLHKVADPETSIPGTGAEGTDKAEVEILTLPSQWAPARYHRRIHTIEPR